MRLIGIAGWSGSGKTTLIEGLIPLLVARGITVSTVKHAHHAFDVDTPGKDSYRHRLAGARDVLVASSARFALLHENREGSEPELTDLCAKLAPIDIVLVEGFKRTAIPKLEVHRHGTGKALLQPDDPWILAVAADAPPPGLTVPFLPLGDLERIADLIARLDVGASWAAPPPSGRSHDPAGPDISVAEASARIRSDARPVCGTEPVPLGLAESVGRILAVDLLTPRALPPADCAAVDGYAFAHGDLAPEGATRMPVTGRAAAGRKLLGDAVSGGAIRIFTGAVLPPGTDTVVMQEDAVAESDAVVIPAGLRMGANRRAAGEDADAGSVVLESGTRLGARHIGLAAACGFDTLPVRRRLRVGLFSTGDELSREGGGSDSNRPMLSALLRRLDVEVLDRGILRDDPVAVQEALGRAAGEADLLITSGGISVGEEDHVRRAVAATGRLDLWRIAMKPGRPLALGYVGETRFLGLPGSPVAAFVGFLRFGVPLVLGLAGARPASNVSHLRAGFTFRKKAGRTEFLRATVSQGPDGMPTASIGADQGAGRLAHLARADALIELAPEVTDISPGDILPAIMLHEAIG